MIGFANIFEWNEWERAVPGVLDGIRVLDFGRYIAGPFVGTMLGDLGAEVIRVEKLDGSEDRFTTPVGQDEAGDVGALFLQLNRNKKGITLNPRNPEGAKIVKRLVETSDVVIANMPQVTLESIGIDYESLKAIKPDIILATVSAFGSVGPYAEKVGFDGVAQAMCGNMHLSGPADVPVKAWAPWVDFGTALSTTVGVLAALREREKSGNGQKVEGTLLGTSIVFNAATLIEQAAIQSNRVGSGNRGQTAGPVDSFKTKDGWILVQVVGHPLFKRWAGLMGEEEKWLNDPRFTDDLKRGENGTAISERMQQWCDQFTTAEALARLAEARIPAGEILTPQGLLDNEHVNGAPYLKEMEYPGVDKAVPLPYSPVRLHGTPAEIRHRAPQLGEHTDEVMANLGLSADDIAALRAAGAI